MNVHINHKVTLNVPASENKNSLEVFKKSIDQNEFKQACLLTDIKLPDVIAPPANYAPLKSKLLELLMEV